MLKIVIVLPAVEDDEVIFYVPYNTFVEGNNGGDLGSGALMGIRGMQESNRVLVMEKLSAMLESDFQATFFVIFLTGDEGDAEELYSMIEPSLVGHEDIELSIADPELGESCVLFTQTQIFQGQLIEEALGRTHLN